jgi:hypothetical protein
MDEVCVINDELVVREMARVVREQSKLARAIRRDIAAQIGDYEERTTRTSELIDVACGLEVERGAAILRDWVGRHERSLPSSGG